MEIDFASQLLRRGRSVGRLRAVAIRLFACCALRLAHAVRGRIQPYEVLQ